MEVIDQNENPYVAVVSRKSRNLKKKLERVLKVEAQLKEGKKLNEEQLVLVASKASLEKALSDVDSIKLQLEEVAKQELIAKQTQAAAIAATTTSVVQESKEPESLVSEKADSSTITHEVELATNSTQCDHQEADAASASDTVNAVIDYSEVLRGHLIKLLKLFHVCSRYSTLSGGNPLPADINYFGKCLLGETTIDSFTKALNQSVRNAELYLDEDLGSQYEAIRGMSYSQISDIIDTLAHQLPQPESPAPHIPSPPPQSPQINFFADGDIPDQLDDQVQFNDSYNAFNNNNNTAAAAVASPFPLPPSAVVMYDQWNNDQSPPVSPSTLAASALGGSGEIVETKIESTSNEKQNSDEAGAAGTSTGEEVVDTPKKDEDSNNNPASQSENRESGGRGKGRGNNRGRGKGRGRGERTSSKEKRNPQSIESEGSNNNSNNNEASNSVETKKGVSWGGQQKKAGGALATVSGIPDAPPPTSTSASSSHEKEGGRGGHGGRGGGGRGGGRGRERWTNRGRGSKEVDSTQAGGANANSNNNTTTTTATSTTTAAATSTTTTTTTASTTTKFSNQRPHTSEGNNAGEKGRGGGNGGAGAGGRSNNRGRGRGYSRGEGRGGNGGRFQSREKPAAVQPSTA